jgi:hypothetical protein
MASRRSGEPSSETISTSRSSMSMATRPSCERLQLTDLTDCMTAEDEPAIPSLTDMFPDRIVGYAIGPRTAAEPAHAAQ